MSETPDKIEINADLVTQTSYGENPWQQQAGLYDTGSADPLAIPKFELVAGTQPSYNNYADVDRMLQTVTHTAAGYDRNTGNIPYIAVGAKHGNACGASANSRATESIHGMLDGDRRAIFGGSIMLNFPVGPVEAEELVYYGVHKGKRLLDVVAAPSFTSEAVEVLNRKNGKLRALANIALESLSSNSLDDSIRTRPVRGGYLAQDNYDFIIDFEENVTEHQSSKNAYKKDLLLAWAIGSTSNSNTITLVKDGMLIGNGVGQQDRVSAAELAVKRAKDASHTINGAVAYSDSFFPFPDGPQKLIDEGVSAILTSSGSVGDEKVFKTITDAGVALYTIPDAAGRGFYAH